MFCAVLLDDFGIEYHRIPKFAVAELGSSSALVKKGDIALAHSAYHHLLKAASIALAAVLPAPIAEITVAAPVTASPPA